jgi:hypothetical protein
MLLLSNKPKQTLPGCVASTLCNVASHLPGAWGDCPLLCLL